MFSWNFVHAEIHDNGKDQVGRVEGCGACLGRSEGTRYFFAFLKLSECWFKVPKQDDFCEQCAHKRLKERERASIIMSKIFVLSHRKWRDSEGKIDKFKR